MSDKQTIRPSWCQGCPSYPCVDEDVDEVDMVKAVEVCRSNSGCDEISLTNLTEDVHRNALEHGWWDGGRSFGDIIALCHSELSEALEEYRKGRQPNDVYFGENCKPEGIGVELADVVIRIMDYCGHAGIDLQKMIEIKHEYNKKRTDKKVI